MKNRYNIFDFYYLSNKKYNFFFKTKTWKHAIAKIEFIEGVKEGQNIKGKAPYYNNQNVYAKLYYNSKKYRIIKIQDPGTYKYIFIENINLKEYFNKQNVQNIEQNNFIDDSLNYFEF